MSDEAKVNAIMQELKQVVLTCQVMMFAQQSIETYRQFIAGELNEEQEAMVDTDEYKEKFGLAVKAVNEILGNLLAFCNNMDHILDTHFLEPLPITEEGFIEYSQMVEEKIAKMSQENQQ